MAINTGMLEVDARTSVLANDDLKLVIPAVCACSHLDTALNLTRTAKHVHAQVGTRLRLGVVQAEDK